MDMYVFGASVFFAAFPTKPRVAMAGASLFVLATVLVLAYTERLSQQFKYNSMTPADIIQSEGYPSEIHKTTTKDGYTLTINRIPRPRCTPVVLGHQLFSSAAGYLILGQNKSLGFLLYDAGFDVWLPNYRGTNFSLSHVSLSSSDDNFWKFGWHENGALDNPAVIEYVLKRTGRDSVMYAGHSMGGTTFFVTGSQRPDLLSKIRASFVFGPAVFVSHTLDKKAMAIRPFVNTTMQLADALHLHKQPVDLLRRVLGGLCNNRFSLIQKLCTSAGLGGAQRFLPDFAMFFPSGGSIWQIMHFIQLTDPKWPGFRQLNMGSAEKNRERYGTATPPEYSLRHITTPVYLYNSWGDKSCTPTDQALLRDSLPNVKRFFYISNKKFTHVDFTLSDHAVTDVWNEVIKDMKAYL